MLKIFSEYLKNFFVKKQPDVTKTLSWNDILKPQRKKYAKSMLMPSNRVAIWKSVEKRQKGAEIPSLSVMFKFDYDGEEILIKTQRSLEQKVLSEALPKISHLIHKKINHKSTDSSSNFVEISPKSMEFLNENSKMSDFFEDSRIQSILVNGDEFRIVRNVTPVQGIQISHLPIAGYYCMPTVSTFDENFEKSSKLQYHWFVKNQCHVEVTEDQEKEKAAKKSKKIRKHEEVLKISSKNSDFLEFLVENYSFKGTGPIFKSEIQDIDKKLAVLVSTHPDHPVYGAISAVPISAGPEELVTDEQLDWCRENELENDSTRIMCYNILADLYLNLNLDQNDLFFKYCEKDYQKVAYRTPLLLRQMTDFAERGVSLFFLQEVDVSRHDNYIRPFFASIQFQSVFSKKLSTVNEGMAVIFDRRKYRLISSEQFGLAQLAEQEQQNEDVRRVLKSSELSMERFMSRPSVVQIVQLEDIATNTVLICANTHLHHNPKEEHLKVLQTLVSVRKVMEAFEKVGGAKKSVLFGGDFNATPDGAVFELMSTGRLLSSDSVWKKDESLKSEDFTLKLQFECLSGTPNYTNYTVDANNEGFIGCLDYLWGIGPRLIRQCPMPSHSKVVEFTAIPSKTSPSDHLPIITDIRL